MPWASIRAWPTGARRGWSLGLVQARVCSQSAGASRHSAPPAPAALPPEGPGAGQPSGAQQDPGAPQPASQPLPRAGPPTAMEAEWPLQEVRRLHARLAASTKPRKLHKYLRRLSALPMTADLLAQTRVRKTVKALRRYEMVGSVARDLAAQWKQLARAQPSPGRAQQDSPPSHSRKRPWAALDDEDDDDEDDEVEDDEEDEAEDNEEEEDDEEEEEEEHEEEEEEQADRGAPEPGTAVGSQPAKPAHAHKRPRRLSELEPRTLASPWRPRQALPRSGRPAQESADTSTWHEEDPDPAPAPAAGLRQPAEGPARAPHRGASPLPQEHWEEAQGKAARSQGQTHKSTPRENGPLRAKAGEAPPASLGQLSSREEHGAKGNPPASGGPAEQATGRPRTPLWSLPQLAADELGKAKRKDPRASRAEKTRQHPQSCQLRSGPEDPRPGLQDNSSHVEAAHAHLAAPALASASGGLLPQAEAQPSGGGGQEPPHQPTMSFEAYMTYDQLEKQQSKAGRPWAAALRGKGPQRAEPPSRGAGADWLQKCPEVTHSQQGKLQPAGAHAAELQDSAPAAAPSTHARDGPSHPLPSCPPRTKAPSAAQQEEDAAFSGPRFQTKMQVYAGARHATRGMTESPMCIAGLEPIASPSAGRGVPPHSLPGPLLEQHTPEELQRVERDNPELLQETDPLWKRHCQRDFKGEKPAGQESWRQMYLRLQSARERRLQALTAAIRSTHASKPKGRQAKMIRFHGMPGPAGDAPGRQDALHTAGASAPRAPGPAGSDRAPSCSSTQHSDSSLSPPPADRPAQPGPSKRLAPWAPGGTTRKQAPPGGSTRKQAPKKIAPLMAKSIRDYKALSRR
uniref:TFIIS N-terminal domain-containing protein n=1 Tax=Oryctolagus cuniculus TaxID=9986 RepID=G1SS24_RABIT